MELTGPEGAHRGGGGLPKTASRAALSSPQYRKTELDVVMDECSVATSTWSPSIARTVFERPLIVPGSRPRRPRRSSPASVTLEWLPAGTGLAQSLPVAGQTRSSRS